MAGGFGQAACNGVQKRGGVLQHGSRRLAGIHGCTHFGLGFGADKLHLDLNINAPGDLLGLDQVTMEADFGAGDLPEYGEVLKGVLAGDPMLNVRGDTAVDCWRIIEPVQEAWRKNEVPLGEYEAGSTGPGPWNPPGLPTG